MPVGTEVLTGVFDRLTKDPPKVKNRASYLMVMLMNELLEKILNRLGGDGLYLSPVQREVMELLHGRRVYHRRRSQNKIEASNIA